MEHQGRTDKYRNYKRSRSRSPVNSAAKRMIMGSLGHSSSSKSDDRHKHSHKSSKGKKSKKEKKSKSKKSKKKHKRSRHSSTSDDSSDISADSDSSTELLMKLEKERLEMKLKRKQKLESLKALETPEEKRARRLLKKQEKRAKDKEQMGWDQDYVHYTNEDNPFGDHNLLENFRWSQKLKQEGLDKVDERELQRIERAKQVEQRQELEKVKQRRLEREREREERETLLELEERKRENDKFMKWQKDEDDFHLQQARLRSKIRIDDGRAKPIDLLAKYISTDENEIDTIEMHEPYTYLNGLTVKDLEDLLVDIRVYEEIDLHRNRDFWNDIVTIVEDELRKLRKMDQSEYQQAADRRQGVNKAVIGEVAQVFQGKSAEQLSQLQKGIEQKLIDKQEGTDIGYWESLLSELKAHLARARLKDKHRENLTGKLEMLKAEQTKEELIYNSKEPEVASAESSVKNSPLPETSKQTSEDEDETAGGLLQYPKKMREDPEEEVEETSTQEYLNGNYSPVYITEADLELGSIIATEEEEYSKRKMDQRKALQGAKVENVMNAEERALEREAKKGMGDDEAKFSVEADLDPGTSYEWSDKYRPRKPRYFNRVHTGFEWNKYNQTHYDIDNPPPKVVQGYKFNIFYPDLINKTSTPQYTLTPCGREGTAKDFCILRIHAGPPYEDIAFKIVNREWEFGYKRGFRCQFHNNIFQLWFHFKRLRYRR